MMVTFCCRTSRLQDKRIVKKVVVPVPGPPLMAATFAECRPGACMARVSLITI